MKEKKQNAGQHLLGSKRALMEEGSALLSTTLKKTVKKRLTEKWVCSIILFADEHMRH